ncbi:MAG TPA: Mur ligase family protein [Thermoanaerobaculia bacterium]|nr:Mur ligase family protein [Thermoanaerobaculia bacterium]HUM28710.1 Mur ligase family protein [Thermoanaerobaculia bacterium]HXK68041.1 Mur ligase family protein [Thermoanaerobaculia bacterium]
MTRIKARQGEGGLVEVELSTLRKVFIQGICGTAMTGTALLLDEMGKKVRGSDAHPGPPMQAILDWKGMEVIPRYDPANLDPSPDLVITGNVVGSSNPEAVAIRDRGIPYLSFPEFMEQAIFPGRKRIVIAGTHGKTTSTCLAASLLRQSGVDAGFLAGGIHRDYAVNARLGETWFAIEADEYETAYFARHPKFFHYTGQGILLTSVEHDHADLYPNEDGYRALFRDFLAKQPSDAVLAVHEDVPFSLEEIHGCFQGTVLTYGQGEHADWRLHAWQPEWHTLTLEHEGERVTLRTPLLGVHNALNTTGLFALFLKLGFSLPSLMEGLQTFGGVRRRQEILLSTPDLLVVDDFAHHPTAVALTISAFKRAYPDRTLIAVFEPRTNTSRTRRFQEAYLHSLEWADRVVLLPPPPDPRIPPEECFACEEVVDLLGKHGVKAARCATADEAVLAVESCLSGPAVILCMSNGPMDNLPARLAERFRP